MLLFPQYVFMALYLVKHRDSFTLRYSFKTLIPVPSISLKCKGVFPVLNQAPRHEDILENGGIAPRILGLGTRWR
jgi:hypothetical protein